VKEKDVKLIYIPVTKPERLYQCGTWSWVYPPKGYLAYNAKGGKDDSRQRTKAAS
jgi:hypothetical protein